MQAIHQWLHFIAAEAAKSMVTRICSQTLSIRSCEGIFQVQNNKALLQFGLHLFSMKLTTLAVDS